MIFILFILLFNSNTLYAQTTDFSTLERPLTIAINKTSYPFHFIDENGEPAGLMVDLWRAWAQKQGVEIEFVPLVWEETLQSVVKQDIDIHAGLSRTKAREEIYNLSSSFFFHDRHIFIHRDFVGIDTIEKLSPYTIGVVKGSSHIDTLGKLNPALKLRIYENRYQLYLAALAGEVIAFAGLEKISKNFPQYKKLTNSYPPYKRLRYHRGEYVSAVAKSKNALLAFIEQGFAKIPQQEKSLIETKWLGFDKQTDTLLLAFTPELPPYMFVSHTGKAQGLFIDIWRLWSEQTGKDIEFIAESMSEAVEKIKERTIDIHTAYPESIVTKTGLKATSELYEINSVVYVSRRLPNISSLRELNGRSIGVFETAPYKEMLAKKFPQLKLRFFVHYQQMLLAAETGEIDAMVASSENMLEKLIRNNQQALFYQLDNPNFQSKIYSLVHSENEELAELIKEGFEQLPIDKLVAIEESWLTNKNFSYFQHIKQKASLTEQESAWLFTHSKIRLGVLEHWAPIEFVNEQGQLMGINSDVLKIVSQRTGLQFQITPYETWYQLYQSLLDGKIDMLANATPTIERREKLLFSKAYWDLPWVVLHPRNIGKQLSLESFYGKQIAIVKGYHLVSKIQQEHPNISLKLVDDIEEGILALQSGVVDGFIENLATASELLKRESLLPLMISVVEKINLDKNHFAMRKDWPMLKKILDKGLTTISPVEKQVIYEKWFDVNIETGLNKSVVVRVSTQIGIILFIVIVIIVVWNRRLYVEIKTRKRLEEKMKHMATHDELTGLANRVLLKDRLNTSISFHQRQSLKIAVLFIDLDGFKNINDTYGHDVGDELLVQVADKLKTCVRQSDTVVRFGGDEFVLLLMGLHKNNEASFVAEKVLAVMQQPFKLSAVTVRIGCSIGISMYPDDGITDTDLLKVADTLMYRVKANGKNHYVFNSFQHNHYHI
ncbi:MAG: transporter substrate-binding domain-containing protein [Colwellia sp.]|nr:transporter substrate-binding domain-containing protein [Colwellia sp.]